MKTLYESILDTEKDYDNDVLISMLFSKDIQLRSKAFNSLLLMIESYHPKQYKTTAKMKNSDSYFIQFSKQFKIENGEVTGELMPHISYIDICKRTDSHDYRTTFINALDNRFNLNISDYVDRWQYIRFKFNPQSNGCTLYEVPEELNELFRQIQMKAYKYK